MATVFDVAKYILEKQGTMTTMKLQKLCYYSQAWSLVWDDQPLFNEDFEAWANGPVCTELFSEHRGMYTISAGELKKGTRAFLIRRSVKQLMQFLITMVTKNRIGLAS